MTVTAVLNQKGGSGKTTTAVNLAAALARRGRRVLLADMDPQAHATMHLGARREDGTPTIVDILRGLVSPTDAIRSTYLPTLNVLPSSLRLSGVDLELANAPGRENRLRDALVDLRRVYDHVLIDCPPSLGLLTVNALCAADDVLITVAAEFFALEGLGQLANTISVVNQGLNPSLRIGNVLITRFDPRKNLCQDVAQRIEQYFPEQTNRVRIRENVRLTEAPSAEEDIAAYDPRSNGAQDYADLAEEILSHEQKKEEDGPSIGPTGVAETIHARPESYATADAAAADGTPADDLDGFPANASDRVDRTAAQAGPGVGGTSASNWRPTRHRESS